MQIPNGNFNRKRYHTRIDRHVTCHRGSLKRRPSLHLAKLHYTLTCTACATSLSLSLRFRSVNSPCVVISLFLTCSTGPHSFRIHSCNRQLLALDWPHLTTHCHSNNLLSLKYFSFAIVSHLVYRHFQSSRCAILAQVKMPHLYHLRRRADNTKSNGDGASKASGGQGVTAQVETLVSVIYVTAPQTFTGAIGGYTTINAVAPVAILTAKTSAAASPTSVNSIAQVVSGALVQSQATPVTKSPAPVVTVASGTSTDVSTTATGDTAHLTSTPLKPPLNLISSTTTTSPQSSDSLLPPKTTGSLPVSVNAAASSQTSDPTTSSQSTSDGLSAGAKAGIAICVVLVVVGLLALIMFCCRRRKKQLLNLPNEYTHNEKNPFDDHAALAPLPTPFMPGGLPSTEICPAMGPQKVEGNATPMTGPIECASCVGSAKMGIQTNRSTNDPEYVAKEPKIDPNTPDSAGTGALSAKAVIDVESATLAQHYGSPNAVDIKRTESPAVMASPPGTELNSSFTSIGPKAKNFSSTDVHRIQLDFKPSMEDELELKAGQLVRLLHEYDDGWVRCDEFGISLAIADSFIGTVYGFRSLPAGCCPSYLSLSSTDAGPLQDLDRSCTDCSMPSSAAAARNNSYRIFRFFMPSHVT